MKQSIWERYITYGGKDRYAMSVFTVTTEIFAAKGESLAQLCSKHKVKELDVIQFIIEKTEYETITDIAKKERDEKKFNTSWNTLP
tara:strand:- start:2558 stop:2815 length:258 start_codon:yes stop_codon:yes gene_type:complete